MEIVFSPDLFILGGGVSKKHDKYLHLLHTQADIKPAEMRNEAGIIGVAMAARSLL
jgi:polyphosphate glucokinase